MRRHRQLVAISTRRRQQSASQQGDSSEESLKVSYMGVAVNAMIALAAVIGLLFTGVGAIMQWRTGQDQLSQNKEARDQRFKEEAGLFDARTESNKLFLANFSRHTVRDIQLVLWKKEQGKTSEAVFWIPNVGPCTSVTYNFFTLKDEKKVTISMGLANIVYKDWEGKNWSLESGGDGLVYVSQEYREALRSGLSMVATAKEMRDWPHTVKALENCGPN